MIATLSFLTSLFLLTVLLIRKRMLRIWGSYLLLNLTLFILLYGTIGLLVTQADFTYPLNVITVSIPLVLGVFGFFLIVALQLYII